MMRSRSAQLHTPLVGQGAGGRELARSFLLAGRGRLVYSAVRRAFDVSFSLLGLVLAAPVMAVVAVWVRVDSPGAAVYRQRRVGRGGREFEILKFRTMVESAEAEGPQWASRNDVRVTRAGRVLRKLYLDEIPQLINVVRGEMSIIGPRPERAVFYPRCERQAPGFSQRTVVRPGVTGLAQVRQRHHSSHRAIRRKCAYDLLYIRQRGVSMDLFIIGQTVALLYEELKEVWR